MTVTECRRQHLEPTPADPTPNDNDVLLGRVLAARAVIRQQAAALSRNSHFASRAHRRMPFYFGGRAHREGPRSTAPCDI
ncbi:unnamed protein product [Colias eurytheme]|nr:unnamed protein product [Colias eurytheme]